MENIITCTRCGLQKKFSDFYKSSVNKSGHRQPCIKCTEVAKQNWKKNNQEKVHIHTITHYQNNQEKRRFKSLEYRKLHPAVTKQQNWKRRAREKQAGGKFTDKEWFDLCLQYDNKCLCCREVKKLTADHVIPISKGGTSNIDNIQPLCLSCNSSKGIRTTDYRLDFA